MSNKTCCDKVFDAYPAGYGVEDLIHSRFGEANFAIHGSCDAVLFAIVGKENIYLRSNLIGYVRITLSSVRSG